jgi:S-adenosylmethionine:diacylglycerol 3-amino-3-carboxypropyl transferase
MTTIFFAQVREDSLVERKLMNLFKPESVLVIGSGGCTAFSILNEDVKNVVVIDQNPVQCALIELKKAAIEFLTREEFLAFIGEKPSSTRQEVFEKVKGKLSPDACLFWEKNISLISTGINQCGVTERFYRFIGKNILHQLYGEEIWNQLFSCKSIEEQKQLYEQYFTSELWKTAVRMLLSKTSHLAFFPAFMFEQANENDFGEFFLQQFEKEVQTKLMFNNYFLSQLLFSRYLYEVENGLPYYLTEEGYEKTKQYLHRMTVVTKPLQHFLTENHSFDAFFLSNIFDWADVSQRKEICEAILIGRTKGAVLLYRNMLSRASLPDRFMESFDVNEELSMELESTERSMMYQKITAGHIR